MKFQAREANSRRRRASSNPFLAIWFVFFFTFFLSFFLSFLFFFFLPTFSIFSRSIAHTYTNKWGAKKRGKAERQRAVRLTRFVDYRLMFDSRRLFIVLKIPRIIACPTSCSASFPYPVAYLFISFATTKSASFPGSSLFLLTILPRPPLRCSM